jgi:hypothetical protein
MAQLHKFGLVRLWETLLRGLVTKARCGRPCTSSLTRGKNIARQARYAVFRHIRGNPETRYTVTCPYRYTLSTLPADGTLALKGVRGGGSISGDGQTLGTGVVLGEPGCA